MSRTRKTPSPRRQWFTPLSALLVPFALFLLFPVACGGGGGGGGSPAAVIPAVVSRSSGPLALTDDDRMLVAASADTDAAVVFDVSGTSPHKLAEVSVDAEPRSVAVLGTKKAYV